MRLLLPAVLALFIGLTGPAAALSREQAIEIGRHKCARLFFSNFKRGVWDAHLNRGIWYVSFSSKPYVPLCDYRLVEVSDRTTVAGACGVCERTD